MCLQWKTHPEHISDGQPCSVLSHRNSKKTAAKPTETDRAVTSTHGSDDKRLDRQLFKKPGHTVFPVRIQQSRAGNKIHMPF